MFFNEKSSNSSPALFVIDDRTNEKTFKFSCPSCQSSLDGMTKDDLQADASFLETVDAPLLELHKSNILKLEIDELLDECRLNVDEVSWAKAAKDYIALLSSILAKAPIAVVSKDGCPFPLKSDKVETLEFPFDLSIVPTGSYGINCLTKKSGNGNLIPTLDCAIVVPNSYWNAKDYLNHRYMDKRNIILWSIANFFSEKKFKKHIGRVQWRFYNGNRNAPALLFTPPRIRSNETRNKRMVDNHHPAAAAKFTVQIVMSMESLNWIPVARLFPNRSNIKGGNATPYYNTILTRDSFWKESPIMIMEDIAEFQSYRDVFTAIKVWCLQRGFLRGHDTLDEMNIGILLSFLIRTRRASSRMSPLHIFTVLMKFLAEEWTKQVFTMPVRGQSESQTVASCQNANAYAVQAKLSPIDPNGDPVTLMLCHEKFSPSPVVLLNSTMSANYLGLLSPAFCHSVSFHAKRTIECLTSTRSFSNLFMTTERFWTCLDSYFHVPIDKIAWKGSSIWGSQAKDLGKVECLSRDIVSILRQALGDRVTDIRLLTTGNGNDIQSGDSDQIPTHDVHSSVTMAKPLSSALGMGSLVVGLKINGDTCHRAVDRGPPADDVIGVKAFTDLWGDAAELRRFKDGAIVHAVVWNVGSSDDEQPSTHFDGDERTQGGFVEHIVQHLLRLHFFREGTDPSRFLLRDMLSMVEGLQTPTADNVSKLMSSTTAAHRNIINSFDSLAAFLRKSSEHSSTDGKTSELGLPLQIDAVEPLSPLLRYSNTFPALPYPELGGGGKLTAKIAGVNSYAPIKIQIRFGRSSKWPSDLNAIGAAKIAMLSRLAEGIESMKSRGNCSGFEGPMVVTPFHLTLGYQGYSWCILVRSDPELHLLRRLQKPSDDARRILYMITKEHVLAASHHSTIHAVHTLHPSASHVVRLVNIWLATHMLSGLIPLEAVELLVARAYSDDEALVPAPATIVSGFFRVLRLIATHDWVRHPLIVDPQGQISDIDRATIRARFDEDRGAELSKGPIMYIVGPYNCKDILSNDDTAMDPPEKSGVDFASWRPTFTEAIPERVTLFRTVALAKRSYNFLLKCLEENTCDKWTAAFRETHTSLRSFNVLLRVNNDFVLDTGFSSTQEGLLWNKGKGGVLESIFTSSARNIYEGPKVLRRKVYRNLIDSQGHSILHDWRPLEATVELLRESLGRYALFFYNEFAPEVVAVLWRPSTFQPKPFNAVNSGYLRPLEDTDWKTDSLAAENLKDFLREIQHATKDIIADIKVFDDQSSRRYLDVSRSTRKRVISEVDSDYDSENSEMDPTA